MARTRDGPEREGKRHGANPMGQGRGPHCSPAADCALVWLIAHLPMETATSCKHKGNENYKEKHYDEALVWYDKCLERDPNHIHAYNNSSCSEEI
jgi:hypothetical protein